MMSALRVFISCAAEDDNLTSLIGSMLRTRDVEVTHHETRLRSAAYRAATLRNLKKANIVIVIWSNASIRSSWVMDEADVGMKKGSAVAVEVGEARSPLGFAGASRAHVSSERALSDKEKREIWEAIVEAADNAKQVTARRLWLDRSFFVVILSGVSNLAIFASVDLLASKLRWPDFFLGKEGILLTAFLGIFTVLSGYAADLLAQLSGTRPREFRRRLVHRWIAEGVGGGLGIVVFHVIAHFITRTGSFIGIFNRVMLMFVALGSVFFCFVLGAKFVPLISSPRLYKSLLGRPTTID